MTETKVKIIGAALDAFSRYGIRRVSMGDVAEAAEVSRQTLYAHYKNKDELCAAAMRHAIDVLLEKLEDDWAATSEIEPKLDAYFEHCVIVPFQMLVKHPDLRDIQVGVGKVTKDVAKELEGQKVDLLARQLVPIEDKLANNGSSSADLAEYIVRTTTDLKYSLDTQEDLERHLRILKAAVLALST